MKVIEKSEVVKLLQNYISHGKYVFCEISFCTLNGFQSGRVSGR